MEQRAYVARQITLLEEPSPGEDVYEVFVKGKNETRILADLMNAIRGDNLVVKSSFSFVPPEDKSVLMSSFFVDFSKAACKPEEFENKVKGIDGILEVKVIKPKPLLFESVHFPVKSGYLRYIIMPLREIQTLWDSFEEMISETGFSFVVYNAGKRSGRTCALWFKTKFKLEGEELLNAIKDYMRAIGMGIVEFHDVNKETGTARVIIRDNFEGIKRRKPRPACYYTRGYIAGILSEVFGKDVGVTEKKCVAAGDEYCEFEAKARV